MEVVRSSDAAQRAHRTPKIHVIAGDHQPAPALSETRYSCAILFAESVASVDGEQPHLLILRIIQPRHHRVGLSRRCTVTRADAEEGRTISPGYAGEEAPQQTEASNMPIILDSRDGGLEEDRDGLGHKVSEVARGFATGSALAQHEARLLGSCD